MQGSTPGFFEKRNQLYAQKPGTAALSAQGRALLEAGLLDDALEMFAAAEDAAGLALVDEAARSAGDTFTLIAARRALGKATDAAEWVAIGEKALAAGLLWFAYRAFEKGEHQEGLERTRREMHAAGIPPEQP